MHILDRLERLASKGALLGWLLIGWTIIGYASTAQFAFVVGAKVSSWLDKHAWAGFLAGFVILALSVFWPELTKRFPGLVRRRNTLTERVDELNKRLLDLYDNQTRFMGVVDKTFPKIHRDRIATIEKQEELSVGISELKQTLESCTSEIVGLKMRLDEQHDWLSDLQNQVKALKNSSQTDATG